MLNVSSYATENRKAYFAGGCFWCMEESFDQVEGVITVVSGYSGGHVKNPTYADVVYTDVFISMGEEHLKDKINSFEGFQVNEQLVSNMNDDWRFMHCKLL